MFNRQKHIMLFSALKASALPPELNLHDRGYDTQLPLASHVPRAPMFRVQLQVLIAHSSFGFLG